MCLILTLKLLQRAVSICMVVGDIIVANYFGMRHLEIRLS
jgi:hypothetical protein